MPTLEIDGMRFTGTHEECAAFARSMRQPMEPAPAAVRPALQPAPQTQTTFLSNPGTWSPPPLAKTLGAAAAAATAATNRNIEELALGFLRELRAHPDGLDSDTVQRLVNASHPKGIGSKLGMINNVLSAVGINSPETCFTSVRNPVTGRRWSAGESINVAIAALETSLRKEVPSE